MRYRDLTLRHELKYYLPDADYQVVRKRLRGFLIPDEHMPTPEGYHVRSLYFDTPDFHERVAKESGVECRTKTRIRVYQKSTNRIRFEQKVKVNQYIGKRMAQITQQEYAAICSGETSILLSSKEPLIHRFYAEQKIRQLRPAAIVDYMREAYLYPAGNVRITFDRNLQVGVGDFSTLSSDEGLYLRPVYPPGMMTLEIKFDSFLPAAVQRLVRPYTARRSEISKYLMCMQNLDFMKGINQR